MKQQGLGDISRESGKSKATVSKVLRGCGGVDAETREAILCVAARMNSVPYEPKPSDIYAILPDNPKFFWHKAYDALKQSGLPIQLKLFSALADDNGYLISQYVEEAVAAGAKVLILSARIPEKLAQRISELATSMLILQFCEYTPISNTFFVGSDAERDGRSLAACVPSDTDRPLSIGVLRAPRAGESLQRIESFLSALPATARVFSVERPMGGELYASHLARAIDALGEPLDYLFCYDGMTAAEGDALYKLRGRMQTRLLGFEYPTAAKKHMDAGRIAALAVQRPDEQMRLALSLAQTYLRERTYPKQKMNYVTSEILLGASL